MDFILVFYEYMPDRLIDRERPGLLLPHPQMVVNLYQSTIRSEINNALGIANADTKVGSPGSADRYFRRRRTRAEIFDIKQMEQEGMDPKKGHTINTAVLEYIRMKFIDGYFNQANVYYTNNQANEAIMLHDFATQMTYALQDGLAAEWVKRNGFDGIARDHTNTVLGRELTQSPSDLGWLGHYQNLYQYFENIADDNLDGFFGEHLRRTQEVVLGLQIYPNEIMLPFYQRVPSSVLGGTSLLIDLYKRYRGIFPTKDLDEG